MANVDWSLQPTALRKVLLKLSKPKLIKLCKQKKISINHAENKKDIIDRLLNASKSSQKKQKDKNSKNVKNKKKIKKPDKVIKSSKLSKQKNNSNTLKQSCTNIEQDIQFPPDKQVSQNIATHQSSCFIYNDDTIYLSWKSQPIQNVSIQQDSEHDWEYEETPPAITIDHGSHTILAGFSGLDCPSHIIDSKVGILNASKIALLEY
eukprot:425760_1